MTRKPTATQIGTSDCVPGRVKPRFTLDARTDSPTHLLYVQRSVLSGRVPTREDSGPCLVSGPVVTEGRGESGVRTGRPWAPTASEEWVPGTCVDGGPQDRGQAGHVLRPTLVVPSGHPFPGPLHRRVGSFLVSPGDVSSARQGKGMGVQSSPFKCGFDVCCLRTLIDTVPYVVTNLLCALGRFLTTRRQ